jgi:outer membrane protein assembly factor BamB
MVVWLVALVVKQQNSSRINKLFVVETILLLFVCAMMPLAAYADSTEESWPMSRHDAERTGATNSAVPLTLPVQLWNFTLNEDGSTYAPPAVVVADGLVFVGSNDLYCFKASTGAKLWSFPLSNECDFTPAVVEGHVYVGSVEGYVYCLDSTSGAQVWNNSVDGSAASPVTYSDGECMFETWAALLFVWI